MVIREHQIAVFARNLQIVEGLDPLPNVDQGHQEGGARNHLHGYEGWLVAKVRLK